LRMPKQLHSNDCISDKQPTDGLQTYSVTNSAQLHAAIANLLRAPGQAMTQPKFCTHTS